MPPRSPRKKREDATPRPRHGSVPTPTSPLKVSVVVPTQPQSGLARIPAPVRFVLVILSSLMLSSALLTATAGYTYGDLGAVSKPLEEWWEVGGLIAWEAVELGLQWFLGFDARDVVSFTFLTHLPTYMLLASFYRIRPTDVLIAFAVRLFSKAAPFYFLRRPTFVHELSHASPGAVRNQSILQDRLTAFYTTIAATCIYMVGLYIGYATWLPTQLVLHFQDIPDISAAHAGPAGLPLLFLRLIPAGWAMRDFLFVSSAGSSSHWSVSSASASTVDETELLIVALWRKTCGFLSCKIKVLVLRTVVLAAIIMLNTVIRLSGTVKGVDLKGAAAWGSVWAVATCIVGSIYGWIEAVDGV